MRIVLEPTRQDVARFWAKVSAPSEDECWLWQSSHNGNGYGTFYFQGYRVLSHRFAYTRMKGEIPEGLVLDHLCRTPPCVNPSHLEAVTPKENSARGFSPAAVNARKTHCIRGHEYTPANTVFKKGGRHRECRICRDAYSLARPSKALRSPEEWARFGVYTAARNRGIERCKRGHDFTPENTILRPNGSRRCKACHKYRQQMYRSRWKTPTQQTLELV